MSIRRFGSWDARVVGFGVALGLVSLSASQSSRAGDISIVLSFANMTPDALSSEASKKCAARLRGALVSSGADVKSIGETALRKAVGSEDKTKSFMGWKAEQVDRILVAVDCRPETQSLDVLFVGLSELELTLRLRGQELSVRRQDWFAKDLLSHVWASAGY
jgi:hypothetical protein